MEVTNRFKGLDLIDKAPGELWTEVCSIVQEVIIKAIPNKNQWKKANGFLRGVLQIAEKRREPNSKGEKSRYTHLNVEFQRIARKAKKAFLSEQC